MLEWGGGVAEVSGRMGRTEMSGGGMDGTEVSNGMGGGGCRDE